MPVRPRSSRSTSSSVWCGATDDRAPLAVERQLDLGHHAPPVARAPSPARARPGRAAWPAGNRARRASRSEMARRRRTTSRDRLAVRPSNSQRPRPEAAVREAQSAVRSSTTTASVTEARSWPRRRVRRWNADPTRPVGHRQQDRRHQLAGARASSRRIERRSRPAPPRASAGRPGDRRAARRTRAAAARCPRRARRCTCCRRASLGCGSGPSPRTGPPRPAPGTSARDQLASRESRSSSCRRRSAPRRRVCSIAGAISGTRLTSTTTFGAIRPVAQPDDQVRAAGQDACLRAVLRQQGDGLRRSVGRA